MVEGGWTVGVWVMEERGCGEAMRKVEVDVVVVGRRRDGGGREKREGKGGDVGQGQFSPMPPIDQVACLEGDQV